MRLNINRTNYSLSEVKQKKRYDICKPGSVGSALANRSIINLLPVSRQASNDLPLGKDEQPYAPIYLVFQLIRFTPETYH